MQRQKFADSTCPDRSIETPPNGELQQIRNDMAVIYKRVDTILDSIGHQEALEGLEQNLQTGAQ